MRLKMSTIKDVAREAGVSTATVSRVLNNNYPVHMDTRIKVEAAVEKLQFRINSLARGLKTKSSFLIGMIAPDISNQYFMTAAKAIEEIVAAQGYHLVLSSTDEQTTKEIEVIHKLHDKQVDAMIIATRQTRHDVINQLVKQGVAIVLMDSTLEGAWADTIVEDDYLATREALTYAYHLGHQRMGILKGNMKVSTAQERFAGYKDIIKTYGLESNTAWEIEGYYDIEKAYHGIKKFFQKNNTKDWPTLIFSSNNRMTEGALIAFKELNIKVPEDISLLSFGNIESARLVEPKLTYVKQEPERMGHLAAEKMLERLKWIHSENEAHQTQYSQAVIPLTLVEGDSVMRKLS